MFGAIAGGIASALAGGAMSKLFGGGQKAASGGIQGDVLATDNNTVGMGDEIGRASCRERVSVSEARVPCGKKPEQSPPHRAPAAGLVVRPLEVHAQERHCG